MSTLADEFAAFARARGLTVRQGPAPQKPVTAREPSIGRTQPVQRPPKADPWLDYTDDYSVWKQGQ